jgi:2-(1,2-epoxy-1,2-dihydrophenyl)acetyl-CoA isomerase
MQPDGSEEHSSETLVGIVREDGVARLTLNRPDVLNALSVSLARALADALIGVASDSTVRAVIITGAGRAFCSGGDLREASAHPGGLSAGLHELSAYVHLAISEIRVMGKPVIAAVNGIAAGGGFSLALACDYRVIAKGATLRQAYTSHGLSIDAGGTFMLPRLVGLARAMEIGGLDKPISADEALAFGLATRVVENAELLASAVELTKELGQRSMHSFAATKALLNESFNTSLETQLANERAHIRECATTAEGIERVRAFIEKRQVRLDET